MNENCYLHNINVYSKEDRELHGIIGWANPLDAIADSIGYREMKERERRHREYCYGTTCISCGCSKDRGPCNSHKDSMKYNNELLEQIRDNSIELLKRNEHI